MTTEVLDYKKKEEELFLAKPQLITRIKSSFIDLFVVITLMFAASKVISFIGIESGVLNLICLGAIFLYEPFFTSLGQTLGQRLMGIKVCKLAKFQDDKSIENINIIGAILRYLTKGVLGWISLLTIHSDKYGQALHDKLVKSVIVYV